MHCAHAVSIITTVAGGSVGDGESATSATLYWPPGVTAIANASSGRAVLYIADFENNRIRRVDEAGVISTVAGTGIASFGGDGGAATAAHLFGPSSVSAVVNASSGRVILHIADRDNHRIRRVNEDGNITTVAGNGYSGFNGNGGQATSTQLQYPQDVAALYNASSGRFVLYIADWSNHRIRKVDEAGIMTTVAGNGTYGFSGDGGAATSATLCRPFGVTAVINASTAGVVLFIADWENNRVRRVDANGIISTVAGDGSSGFSGDGMVATATGLNRPTRMSALYNASSGGVVLYIADSINQRVRRVDEGGIITSVAGDGGMGYSGDGGTATNAMLCIPYGVCAVENVTSGGVALYIADTYNQRIRRVDEVGVITTLAGGGVGDHGAAKAASLYSPQDVAALTNASTGGVVLYIADTSNNCIRRVDEASVITTVAGVCDSQGDSGDGGPAVTALLHLPTSLVPIFNVSSGGVVLYIADSSNHRIRRVVEGGSISTVAGNGAQGFLGDNSPATIAKLSLPSGVAVVHNASTGRVVLYIADTNNRRVRRVDADGIITTVAGTGSIGFDGDGGPATAAKVSSPYGVCAVVNTSSGGVVLYIADASNKRIRRVGEEGNIITVAGSGNSGASGDGGPATAAAMNNPRAVLAAYNASTGSVVLYIADSENHRIRRVDEAGRITTAAGVGVSNFMGDGGPPTAAMLRRPCGIAMATNSSSGEVVL
ncbi:hypothetical protein EON62_01605, partial [archaeon]